MDPLLVPLTSCFTLGAFAVRLGLMDRELTARIAALATNPNKYKTEK